MALSGTPTDPTEASANTGQSVTLNGVGLSLTSDVVLRYVDVNGRLQVARLNPSAAAADGTSATLIVPAYANGAFSVQLFGSTGRALLQIVPTLTSFDIQDRTALFGSGFVEGASSYSFAGAGVFDTPADPNDIDVDSDPGSGNQSGAVYLDRTALPTHGLGNVTVTTAGGTSDPLALNTVRVNVAGTGLGDVAVDPSSGAIWVSDIGNPGHLLKIDAATGHVLQTITLTSGGLGLPDFGSTVASYAAGLQVLGAAMTLGSTNVPAGSLLFFDGVTNPDRVTAVNTTTGLIITSLILTANYDLTGAAFDPATGDIFLNEVNGVGTRIVAVRATTGAPVNSSTAPFNVNTPSGLAIDPTTGHLWLGSTAGGSLVVEYLIGVGGTLTELSRRDLSSQGINQNEISGLSFDSSGKLWVSSTQGELYRVTP